MCLFKRRKRRRQVAEDFVDLYIQKHDSGSKKGADIIPGDVPVPTSDTLYWTFYEAEDGRQWCITSIETKFFFFIPFTYAEYVIDLGIKRYNSFCAEDAVHEISEADNWNKRDKMRPVFSCGWVYFHRINGSIETWEYEIGNNDYTYLKYSEQEET